MDRRMMVVALAATALAAGATRQASAQGAPAMGEAEMDHAKKTAMVGAVALMTSDVALTKARNVKAKEFAQFEHDEQTTVAEILKSMNPSMTVPSPDPKMAEMVTKLKGMQSGAAFDKAYVAGQIEGHEMLLKIQDDYLKAGKDVAYMGVAKLVRGMVKEHLVLLSDLRKAVG